MVMKSCVLDSVPEMDGKVRAELVICAMQYRHNKDNKNYTDVIQVNQMDGMLNFY